MNNYHIYEKLGRGKHSTVYKGRKKKSIQYYAIKSVDKDQKQRVLQEVRTMHALDHKNILKFFAWYETTNHLWLILEYCVGGDLLTLLRTDVRLPEPSVHDFARDLVIALQYLHSNSIVYCDLKPSNVLLDENGRLKLGGFGLSRRLSDINKTPYTTIPQAKRGTPCYMAPELFNGDATHSTASDLWALGCVLYECAMGRAPFMNASLQELIKDILNKEPQQIPGASPEFADLITRLIDKNPATRIKWQDLVSHPFWQVQLSVIPMPPEPAFEDFIAKHCLAPTREEQGVSASMAMAGDRAKNLRQSVDITRLSKIALYNLEKEGEGLDYAAAEAQQGDIKITDADAEIDFEDLKDDAVADDEEAPSPASVQNDDGLTMDQGDGGKMGGVMTASMTGKMQQAQPRRRNEGLGASQAQEPVAGAKLGGSASAASPGTGASGASNGAGAASSTAPLDGASVAALIWHASDTAVKPIVANRRIERLPEPKFDAKALPFPALSLQELLRAEHKDLEALLTQVYRAIASAAPLKDKVNVLCYFETLCTDGNSANSLINSSLTILFIRMMRNARAPTLRIRLASVLGLLVRHAIYISEELAQTSVIEVLTEALKDKNERVRRRVMATLGELLFYIATTQQDVQEGGSSTVQEAADVWQITGGTVAAVVRLLKPQEDEIAQHYAVKTIENICSQGGDWAAKFCSEDVVFNLVQIYNSTKNENLKATAASTLARLLRHSPALVTFVVDKVGVRLFLSGLADANSKIQTAAVNMLNLALSQQDLSMRAKAALSEERSLVPHLMALLDHSLLVLRAKGIVAVLLLCRLSTRWLMETCRVKLISTVEKLQQRDKDDYLQQAVAALRNEMSSLVPVICAQCSEELTRLGSRKTSSLTSSGRPSSSKNPLQQFPVVLHLVTSPYFRSSAVTAQLIADLGAYLTATTGAGGSSSLSGLADFKATLMEVLEALCKQTELVLQHYQAMLDHLLPAVCEVVATRSESGDTRFFCLRMVLELTQLYIMDPDLYGGSGQQAGSRSGSGSGLVQQGLATAVIDRLLREHVLPTIPQLLQDEDPMPLYALKLLGSILQVNMGLVRDVEALGLAPMFFSFLSLDHSNNNVHNIQLCRQIIAGGSLPVAALMEMQVAEKVATVLEYAQQNSVEQFLEPVLELSHTIVQRDMQEIDARSPDGGHLTAVLLDKVAIFLELSVHADLAIGKAAATCVLDLVLVFPPQVAPWLLAADTLAFIVTNILQGEECPPGVQQVLLEALSHAVKEPSCVPARTPELLQLYEAVQGQASSGEAQTRMLALQLAQALKPCLQ